MIKHAPGTLFDHSHAAGVTRFRVVRPHRDCGFYECVAVEGVSGTHHFVGGIEVFSAVAIARAEGEDR